MNRSVAVNHYMRNFFSLFSRSTPHLSQSSTNGALPSIVIKIPVSKWKRAYSWGDTHMAVLLKEQLVNLGHQVLIQVRSEWYNKEGKEFDVAIVFRGLKKYKIDPRQKNIMWNISHPEDITLDEYETYDHVYIASNYWAGKIKPQVLTPVEVMLQCTDLERFRPPVKDEYHNCSHQLLFVGNSRGIFRKIIKDLLPTKFDLAVYGEKWGKFIPDAYIKGLHIENENLYKYYGSASILLNDHWVDMRDKGFVSNRIFDGLACKAFIISDKVSEMGELSEFFVTYESKEELSSLIEYYLNNLEQREVIVAKGLKFVSENHTFKNRAKQFSTIIKNL